MISFQLEPLQIGVGRWVLRTVQRQPAGVSRGSSGCQRRGAGQRGGRGAGVPLRRREIHGRSVRAIRR